MTRKTPPGKEECLKKHGEGCRDCESRGTHGGRAVCRRQVAGKYNRQIFYKRNDPNSRPNWCPKSAKNARKGYATTEPLPEAVGKKKPTATMPPSSKCSPMPLNPKTHLERPVPKYQKQEESTDNKSSSDPPTKPKPKPKLKRKAKDAPWGVTEE